MIDNTYNYLMQNYIPKSNTPYDIHKKSELRNIYGTIVNKSRHSPLYKVKLSEDKQRFAINLKDTALSLKSALAAVNEKSEASVFHSKKAYSDQPDKVTAEITSEDLTRLPEGLTVKVDAIASPQRNTGATVYENGIGPEPGSYSFQIQVEEDSYEFQFNIGQNTIKNKDILTKLSNFINKSDIGVRAELKREDDKGRTHMELESVTTGNTGSAIFSLKDTSSPRKGNGLVSYYDLNHMAAYPSNAKFQINGEDRESMTNRFLLNHSLRISLLDTTETACAVHYQPDSDKILSRLHQITDTYNSLIRMADEHMEEDPYAGKLAQELKSITSYYKNDLEAAGIAIEEDGSMKIDDFLGAQAAREGDLEMLFGSSSGLAGRLSQKMATISIDPMEYVDKTLVTYPNTAKPGTANPYMISIYSGMLFNYYY